MDVCVSRRPGEGMPARPWSTAAGCFSSPLRQPSGALLTARQQPGKIGRIFPSIWFVVTAKRESAMRDDCTKAHAGGTNPTSGAVAKASPLERPYHPRGRSLGRFEVGEGARRRTRRYQRVRRATVLVGYRRGPCPYTFQFRPGFVPTARPAGDVARRAQGLKLSEVAELRKESSLKRQGNLLTGWPHPGQKRLSVCAVPIHGTAPGAA